MTVQVIFPDGSLIEGESYRAVEDRYRAAQFASYRTRAGFRAAIRRRAKLWSATEIGHTYRPETSREFIRSLADAGLCVINEAEAGEPLRL